ncbi:MAG: hypothetical protein IIB00_06090 [candidate division Zixibacteria bacterium]|nr:hypothetical protein [candidate division Zixibacteria bacterium]
MSLALVIFRFNLVKISTSTDYVQFTKPFDTLLGAIDRFMELKPIR